MQKTIGEFRSPSNRWRGKPFWAWNSRLDKDELLRQIACFAQMGFGGFFMHSRTGLATEYLGREWFDRINACVREAEKKGMEAWLYDEDRWPSGTAGGMVTADPELGLHYLEIVSCAPGVDQMQFERVFCVRTRDGFLESFEAADPARYVSGEGDWYGFRVVPMKNSSFYNGYTYVDTMNGRATERFLELTHERYERECGESFGKSIPGVFTDEPHRGSLMSSFGEGNCKIPFTRALPAEYRSRFGEDVMGKLPLLFFRTKTPCIQKWRYVELLQELFLENFADPICRWCEERGLIFTGHVLHENSLAAQTAMSGSVMRFYEFMTYPGIDYLGREERCWWIAKQVQSVARQLGKERILSELYGATGWHATFLDYKRIGDWQALFGVNLRCPHLSWYTMAGQAKRDYPASISGQSAWWKEYAFLETYFARIGAFLSQGAPCCEVLVLYPVESVWAQVHMDWCSGLSAKDERICALEAQFEETFWTLQRSHVDFDYGDEGILAVHGRVDGGRLLVGNAVYRYVVVSGMETIRASTAALLKQFAENGGTILVWGDAPHFVGCVPTAKEIPGVRIPRDRDALVRALPAPGIRITANGEECPDVFCQARRIDGAVAAALLHDDPDHPLHVRVTCRARGIVARFIPETGEIVACPCVQEGEYLTAEIDLEPDGMCLLTFGDPPSVCALGPAASGENESCCEGPFAYELDEKNVCVLDFAEASVDGLPVFEKPEELLRIDAALRDRFGLPRRSGEMLQPWCAAGKDDPAFGDVSLRFSFACEAFMPIQLVMESPDRFTAFCNGHPLRYEESGFFWADDCFKMLEIPVEYLKPGRNEIVLRTRFRESTNLESVYLLGDFGVSLDGTLPVLTKLPETLSIGDAAEQGLAFYGGKITFFCPVPEDAGSRVQAQIRRFGGACISYGGGESVSAWPPFRTDVSKFLEERDGVRVLPVTVVLTRRNTFGPFHTVPAVLPAMGPEAFEPAGDAFQSAYGRIPSGLLEPIRLTWPE